MAQLQIPYGSIPNDPNQANDIPLRTAFQRTQDNFTDLYALQSRIVSAGDVRFAGQPTTEAKIQAAINQAVLELATAVFVPAFMLPYNTSLVTFNNSVRMTREGGDFSVHDIRAYGADPNGLIDAVPAIRAAGAAANAVAGGGSGIVDIPNGVYLLSTVSGGRKALIPPFSNVVYSGRGQGSVLKVAAGLNAGTGFFNVFSPLELSPSHAVTNTVFTNFTIDENGENNLVGDPTGKTNGAVMVDYGSHIVVDNVTVLNNPGRQTFAFGANLATASITDVWVRNCEVKHVGQDVPGNTTQNDHSVVYANGERIHVTGNTFWNTTLHTDASGIEVHGTSITVSDNIVHNFNAGLNVGAQIADSQTNIIANNVFKSVRWGVRWYVDSPYTVRSCHVTGNIIEQATSDQPIFDIASAVNNVCEDITIQDNTCSSTAAISTATGPAVYLSTIKWLTVKNNVFRNLLGRCIYLASPTADSINLNFSNNTVIDCGRTTGGATHQYVLAIYPGAAVSLKSLRVAGNMVLNTSTQYTTKLIDGNVDVTLGVSIVDNTLFNVPAPHITWTSAITTPFVIHHVGNSNPGGTVRASAGSRWSNGVGGLSYRSLFLTPSTSWAPDDVLENTGDIGHSVVTGGFRQTIDGWIQDNVSASQTNVELTRATGRFRAARAGSVTAVVVTATEARTAGTLTVDVFKNTGLAGAAGSSIGLTAVLDGTNTSRKATTQAKDTDTFAAGDELYAVVTTDSAWLPVTSDIRVAIEVED